jgi:threonine aldolase
MKPQDIRARLRRQDLHAPETSLICLENAHSSGKVVSLKDMDAARAIADEWRLPVHLDGARIFNAAAALGCESREIAARADSVMFCLSKGLCAPVGSLLAGTKEFIGAARFKRKVMGGGMRQAGVLAAAGIIALTEHTQLLAADHARAKKLAQGLAEIHGVTLNPDDVEINMVFFSHAGAEAPEQAKKIAAHFAARGIAISPPENGFFRFATHYWIRDNELGEILQAAKEVF